MVEPERCPQQQRSFLDQGQAWCGQIDNYETYPPLLLPERGQNQVVGKSTPMKRILKYCRSIKEMLKAKPAVDMSTVVKHRPPISHTAATDRILLTYFFNARGSRLEKSYEGVLRSLVYQLVDQYSYERFLPRFRDKEKKADTREWQPSELKDYLLSECKIHRSERIILLVDALDECNEADRHKVVELLEALGQNAVASSVSLSICLSSRHWPTITMRKHLQLVVESERKHEEDVTTYVRNNLIRKDPHLIAEILRKASGVFLWVILVVAILNKAHFEGKVESKTMHDHLNSLPSELDALFESILNRDNPDKHETIFLLQFMVFRLDRDDRDDEHSASSLYFAMVASTTPQHLVSWDLLEFTIEDMMRRIISSSRGLLEEHYRSIEDEPLNVQFIHQSVIDFLLKSGRFQKLDPVIGSDAGGVSHSHISSCCMEYLEAIHVESILSEDISVIRRKNPFFDYAVAYILLHAETAQKAGVPQDIFLDRLRHNGNEICKRIMYFLKGFPTRSKYSPYGTHITLLYTLSSFGCFELIKLASLTCKSEINEQVEVYMDDNRRGYDNVLHATLDYTFENRDKQRILVELLIEYGADVNARGGKCGTPLHAAAYHGLEEEVGLLLRHGADIHAVGDKYHSVLHAAAHGGSEEMVERILCEGVDINMQGGKYGNALQAAAESGKKRIVELLIKKGANVNLQGGEYGTALQAAVVRENKDIVKLLIKKGANVNLQGGEYGTALQAAAAEGHQDMIVLLINARANVNWQGGEYGNALQAAAAEGHQDIVKLLIEEGANINLQGGKYGSVLQAAAASKSYGNKDTVQLLIKAGANVNLQGGLYGNALQAAAAGGHKSIVEMLLDNRAEVNRGTVEAATEYTEERKAYMEAEPGQWSETQYLQARETLALLRGRLKSQEERVRLS